MVVPSPSRRAAPVHGSSAGDSGISMIRTHKEWQHILATKQPTVVMFSSKMCGMCKVMKTVFQAMPAHAPKDFAFMVVDLDVSDRAVSMSALGEIAFVPAFQIFCDGDRVDYFIANDHDTLKEKIDKADRDLVQKRGRRGRPGPDMGCGGCLSGMWASW
eukprot:CAMPEP_0204539850 /NCGR_PEP_ID=MMETSP0661-20131031/17045_1 /ASSEMBLY_ACC=CAM_ASM_000606 /TAXON_ID=109239 /ORGANISM="Alexandrium margalefi, Strain AMGDE01CS-322" /LENGTH=158 /DNA_ID=CAMNT_0051546477 /DNA_START=35 /DNA_END=508 /DNA_ORIENTATION=+